MKPQPYWTSRDGRHCLYLGDCLDVLPGMEPGSVDAVVTDPPYSSGGAFRADRSRSTSAKYIGGGYVDVEAAYARPEFQGDNKDQRSYLAWCTMWLAECLRATRRSGLCLLFTDWRQLPTTTDALQCGGWFWRGIVVWDKTEAARPQRGWFRNQCEFVAWGSHGGMAEGGECHPGVFRRAVLAEGKEHIAGKPEEVMAGLVRIVPEEGLVLDPFAGSGTTGVACIRTGRRFVGVEIEKRYADIAVGRMERELSQPHLPGLAPHEAGDVVRGLFGE